MKHLYFTGDSDILKIPHVSTEYKYLLLYLSLKMLFHFNTTKLDQFQLIALVLV